MRKFITILILGLLSTMVAQGQIRIGGNVYGGGNQGEVKGTTSVTVKAGDIGAVLDTEAERPLKDPKGKVFGGARMANVGGYSYVHIDGAHATDYILANQVYGGNDIAGQVGTARALGIPMPADSLTAIKRSGHSEDNDNPRRNSVDNTFNSYVRVSCKNSSEAVYYTAGEIAEAAPGSPAYGKTIYDVKTAAVPAADAKKIYIGQLFGGGNGEYDYEQTPAAGDKVTHTIYSKSDKRHENPVVQVTTDPGDMGFQLPEQDKTYLEVVGGSIVYGYGGGNNATVKTQNIIHYDNPSKVVNHILVDEAGVEANNETYENYEDRLADNNKENDDLPTGYTDLLTTERFKEMGINTTFSHPSSDEFQVGRFFGGNNLAEMHIRPTWNLLSGKIRNLYSGGNRGAMTSPEGLLLEIKDYSTLIVDNLYGGCRMADVMPTVNGVYVTCDPLPGYKFPGGFSARVRILGGDINNVYGGNDVTGTVYGGNAVALYTGVRGDVYGGGNGAYPYTDNEQLADNSTFGDFYYDPGLSSAASLKAFRPNAEQVTIRLSGTDADHPTVIKGSVYLGGNCASLATKLAKPTVELKMGSHVIVNNVFLGNNGAGMINPDYLKLYAGGVDESGNYDAGGTPFSSLILTDQSVMAEYMDAVTMTLQPSIVFDKRTNNDPAEYIDYSSSVGSFYCGGNVGSMGIAGKNTYHIDRGLNIFEKFVGGSNNADVAEGTYNAAFEGGVLGTKDERSSFTDAGGKIKDRLEINFENMTITPKRWNDAGTELVWNTGKWGDIYSAVEEGTTLTGGKKYYTSDRGAGEFTSDGTEVADGTNYFFKETEQGFYEVDTEGTDPDRRLLGGNIYGGCYNSGHVNGNVIINILQDVIKKDEIFAPGNSTVELEDQRDDLNTLAMSVFGAGYGEKTEIWGSTTVNHNNGYAFQIYGGGQSGVVGKKEPVKDDQGITVDYQYQFNPAFSCTVNLNGASPIYSHDGTAEDLAEAEYLYGGGNEGDVCGNTYVNLGNGRIYDAFGGASDANIWGHTEVIIGRQPNGSGGYKLGFPWIRDIVYGGNDFGGEIKGAYEDGFDATARVQNYATVKEQLHGYAEGKHSYLLKGSSYVEYLQGRVDTIFGGGYGYYDYVTEYAGGKMPRQESAFVNLRPVSNDRNSITGVFGAGTGYPGNRKDDKAQDHSYVLVDLTDDNNDGFKNMEVFGSGSYNGLGMRENVFAPGFDLDKASAIVDLLHGEIGSAYGGSYREGNTARTVVNVPEESNIKVKNIFGGAYGLRILPPCDVIQSNVNYCNTSENAVVTGAIYGGNNNQRRAIFTNVNISSPVWSDKSKGYLANVYGAGKGFNSWSEHTNVELLSGAKVYEVYGGGEMGHVLNAETVQKYMQNNKSKPSVNIAEEAPWNDPARWDGAVGTGTVKTTKLHEDDDHTIKEEWDQAWIDAWSLGDYYTPNETFDNYFNTFAALRSTSLVRKAEIDERDYTGYTDDEKAKRQYIYNTNVIIKEGAEVVNYAYGGGYGSSGSPFSGDVWGHTYIALLGGKVRKDIYAAGTAGAVDDAFAQTGAYNASSNPYGFTASATAYIKGGSCRNVYGGGWEGNVGLHSGGVSDSPAGDKPGETYVVIGDIDGSSFTNGIPTIQRNAYGGGEGGAVYGTANVKLNKGYIGYEYKDGNYVEKIEDDTKDSPNTLLEEAGCLFGGGYIDNSTVDKTNVILNDGVVRNSVFGGGEIAAIGRGDMKANAGGTGYELKGLYRPGKTHVEMYKGYVQRNVYGGGRGYDNLGRVGSLNSPGYIFGQTEVHVHGGEIGTAAGVAKGDGNVFGGGDVGHVYSAYENSDGTFGKGVKRGERYDGVDNQEGYYYKHAWADDGAFDSGYPLTEDCKVVVEPMLQVMNSVTIDGHNYVPGQFVPIDTLNMLKDKNTDVSKWSCLDQTGIVIHNAVFAGGNNPPGSSATSANTASVFGNATASINDVFHRDLITLGTRHTGGLYGDGNLTLVDGYRELNITSYGTDYYSIKKEITINEYHDLPEREAAYYELRYTCLKDCKDKEGTQYHKASESSKASTITADELQTLFLIRDGEGNYSSVTDGGTAILTYNSSTHEWEPNPSYWEESGVLPVYAGRLMNSIQRADFCGVFGSRMVMQGAQDRVPEEADYTNYTINRVREVSLNKKASTAGDAVEHGNYFGIYNIVNYLGALTSDVDFGDDTSGAVRKTDNTDAGTYKVEANGKPYETATYYDWKKEFHLQRKRNNGSSHNKVALASGVYLEITTEESTGPGLYEKVWGPITGVVELDLINVSPGIGGGFVYAKNIHGKRTLSGKTNTTLTDLNTGAITQKKFLYNATSSASHYTHDAVDGHDKTQWQSSGNFVHSTQTIIDDCYNVSNRYMNGYKAPGGVPAHYWYIKGTTYVYDQYISSFTGSANAYSEEVEIPLSIAAASHGKLKLLEVKPNRYAYYSAPGVKLEDGKKMVINDQTYYANDPISYWDWYLLTPAEKELFVEKTYTNCVAVSVNDGTLYEPGTLVMTDTDYDAYDSKNTYTYKDAEGNTILDANKNTARKDYIFRESNNASHDTGYLLTYEVNNPSQWDNWYTPKSDATTGGKITLAAYEVLNAGDKAKYEDGPTYRLKGSTSTMLGQQTYAVGDIISKDIEDIYQAVAEGNRPGGQATFQPAYVVTSKITVIEGTVERHYNPGTFVSETFAQAQGIKVEDNKAYICTKTVQISKDNLILKDSKMTKKKWQELYDSYKEGSDADKKIAAELLAYVVPAYYCTTAGLYGGNYYQTGHNYRGLEAWSSMSATDREKFTFNYDALDLFIDPSYSKDGSQSEGQKYQYDGEDSNGVGFTTAEQAATNKASYSLETAVDYTATYNGGTGDKSEVVDEVTKYYMETTAITGGKVYVGDELTREQFESLPNEQRHYAPIAVNEAGTYYVVSKAFQVGATPYAVGTTISSDTYNSLPDKSNVTPIEFASVPEGNVTYYCREDYTSTSGNVTKGTLIPQSEYNLLPNQQKNFTIHGISPTETSTFFVSRESDIYNLSKEKIITVIYQYDYEETDGSGNVTPVSERHVLNIHLQFKSGVPIVEDITPPEIILPGWFVDIGKPDVTPGAYEVTGGGWELFESLSDAERHTNGVDYTPSTDPLYWYQDGYYVSYYAKTYLGRTYSNHVPVSVANYHDLADVMSDANKEHHMYIDNSGVKREPKIYINDYSASGKNGLDLFKQLYDLSTGEVISGHAPLNTSQVGSCKNLEFFMRTDIDHGPTIEPNPAHETNPSAPETITVPHPWTSIGTDAAHCFDGVLHGDGHTISGLDNSLFNDLCGEVYNLGVMGTFNTAGVVNTGKVYVESCWTRTTNETALVTKPYPVFGAPSDNKGYQVVNSYYFDGNKDIYNTTDGDPEITYTNGSKGNVTRKSAQAFYNGELAYDLNNFYLYKRYSDKNVTSGTEKQKYSYFTIGNDGKLALQNNHYYDAHADLCSTGYEYNSDVIMYVEDRFADGDFRYAAGEIPDSEDERYYSWKEDEGTPQEKEMSSFFPIYPDDYIFFGQKLTYGHNSYAHQDVPTAVARDEGRLSLNEDANRVYRAPAYFRSKNMGVYHFNPTAYLAFKSNDGTQQVTEKAMTAIDFAGHQEGHATSAYKLGLQDGWFYSPLLDDDGLISIKNCDETQNLLVYAPAASGDGYANAQTHGVLTSYFVDPAYDSHYDYAGGYRLVSENTDNIRGHLVQSDLTATNDHLLVDKQDFNAPLAYTFDADHLMWYQRKPSLKEYVDINQGWQGISLPFTAELVTTHQKGEITHFYGGSRESENNTHTKIGHEYWLRELTNNATMTLKSEGVLEANFHYPAATGAAKEVANTFLWDYYYKNTSVHNQKDENDDTYLQYRQYYQSARNYSAYPLLAAATPYILGLPGQTYYEFDLSGKFVAQHTAVAIDELDKQVITFASNKAAAIGVSDDEMAGATVKYDGTNYTFKPSYMNETLEAGTNSYTLKPEFDSNNDGVTDCSVFDKVPASGEATAVSAFRPYFISASASSGAKKRTASQIVFGSNNDGQIDEPLSVVDGTLEIYAKDHKIITTSHLKDPVAITIVSVAGITYTSYMLQPGETIETPVHTNGVYIVNKRKILVK